MQELDWTYGSKPSNPTWTHEQVSSGLVLIPLEPTSSLAVGKIWARKWQVDQKGLLHYKHMVYMLKDLAI